MDEKSIFVFGSNRAGRHGAGAALHARRNYRAELGVGEGLTGRAYAIPTKDERLRTLPLDAIKEHVERFLAFARKRCDLTFELTPVGCGLAGYHAPDIAPMFRDAPDNVKLPPIFRKVLER